MGFTAFHFLLFYPAMQLSPSSGNSNTHAVTGLLLFITGLLIVLVGVSLRSQADAENATTTVGITNATPVVSSVNVGYTSQTATGDSALALNEAETKHFYVFGTYSDENGCADVNASGTLRLVMYRTGSAATSTSAGACNTGSNLRYCYDDSLLGTYYSFISSMASNTCDGGTDTEADYEFTIKTKFYVDPTAPNTEFASETWQFNVYAHDAAGASGWNSVAKDVADLTALNLEDFAVAFGTLGIGESAISTSNEDIDFMIAPQNTGNRNTLDIGLSGTAMSCSLGTIPVGNIKYSTGTYDNAATYASYPGTLSTSNVSAGFYLGLARGAQDAELVTTNTHWGIQIPLGVNGDCAGTITFTAQAQP